MAGMPANPRTMRLSRGLLVAIAAAALVCAFALVYGIATADFGSDRGVWIAAVVVIGFGFVGAGLFAWYRNPANRIGVLMVATGFAWYVGMLARTEPPLLFSIGFTLENLYVACAVHLLLAYPSGRLEGRIDRVIVACTYATVTLGFVPVSLFVSSAEYGCVGCPGNVFLIEGEPSFGRTWLDGLSALGVVVPLAVVARLVQRWHRASRPLRRTVTPVFLAGAALMITLATLLAIALLGGSMDLIDIFFYSSLPALALVPFLSPGGLARGRMRRGRGLGRLVRRLGASLGRGELRAALAEALGDPSVELAYWLPDRRHYVDAEGRPLELPAPETGRSVTEVDRDGRRIAAIVHDPTLLDDPERVREAGAAAALALENERLEAELRAIPPERLHEHIELTAYYVISEALTNITKYACANRAWVSVTHQNGRLLLEVGDDGVGGADVGRGTGLRGLADRLDAIEGRLYVESEPGRGTTVRATMPSA